MFDYKQRSTSKEYRDNYDRVFGKKPRISAWEEYAPAEFVRRFIDESGEGGRYVAKVYYHEHQWWWRLSSSIGSTAQIAPWGIAFARDCPDAKAKADAALVAAGYTLKS